MGVASALELLARPSGINEPGTIIELEFVDCLLCGCRDFEPVVAASDPITGASPKFRVVRCQRCQLAFTNPRPTQSSIGQFYPADYEPYRDRQGAGGWRGRLRRQVERAVLRTHYGYPLPPPGRWAEWLSTIGLTWMNRSRQRAGWIPYHGQGRLLDFGCGAGRYLREMREFGWSAEGLEISALVAQQVEERTDIRVHVGTLPHPDIHPESFDVVTMWNALEHVHWPREVLKAAHEALRPEGLLVVGVPNFQSWSFRMFGQEWFGLELPRHLVHFTPATLAELIGRERFKVQSVQHIARVGWLRRSARRAARHRQGWRWLSACRWKPLGLAVAEWTERTGQADYIRVMAEKD